MAIPALHPVTKRQLDSFLATPTHAILLTAPTGSGKATLSQYLAAQLLDVSFDAAAEHPYITIIRPVDNKAIGIESIRELEHFLSLKVPGKRAIDRVVIIEDSHLLTLEAQNALLKTLEEPPRSTVLILTAQQEQALLPTVRSRVQTIPVIQPTKSALLAYFSELGFSEKNVQHAYAISGGLPGLMQALLSDTDHPLSIATDYARRLLQGSAYDRLLLVDELSKQRLQAENVCFIMQQMAHLSLQSATETTSTTRWQTILNASYQAAQELANSAQPKLVLTNLMLNLA